jgi:hypothetical protein
LDVQAGTIGRYFQSMASVLLVSSVGSRVGLWPTLGKRERLETVGTGAGLFLIAVGPAIYRSLASGSMVTLVGRLAAPVIAGFLMALFMLGIIAGGRRKSGSGWE